MSLSLCAQGSCLLLSFMLLFIVRSTFLSSAASSSRSCVPLQKLRAEAVLSRKQVTVIETGGLQSKRRLTASLIIKKRKSSSRKAEETLPIPYYVVTDWQLRKKTLFSDTLAQKSHWFPPPQSCKTGIANGDPEGYWKHPAPEPGCEKYYHFELHGCEANVQRTRNCELELRLQGQRRAKVEGDS
eukprot:1156866-Pelagomonas_calceolata.AAC.1